MENIKNMFESAISLDGVPEAALKHLIKMFEQEEEKKKRDWYGIPGIKFIFLNEWADPLIEYKGRTCSCSLVEDAMWEMFLEDGGDDGDYDAFAEYMRDNSYMVFELAENVLFCEDEDEAETA